MKGRLRMEQKKLTELLEQVADGRVSVDQALLHLKENYGSQC